MTKVVITKLKQHGNTSVKTKRVRSASGKFRVFHTLDADSPTFVNDLNLIFRKNVAKARRDNRRRNQRLLERSTRLSWT